MNKTSNNAAGIWKLLQTKECSIHSKPSEKLFWSHDGIHLLTLSADKMIKICEFNPAKSSLKIISTTQHTTPVAHVCFSPIDRFKFAIVGDDKFCEIWDVRQPKPINKIACGMGNNLDVCWSPNGNFIAISNEFEYIGIIDVLNGLFLRKVKHHHSVRSMQWAFNSQYLLVGTASLGSEGGGFLEVFHCKEDALVPEICIAAHTSHCSELKIDPSYSVMAIASADFLISIWDLSELICYATISKFDEEVRSISFSPDGKALAVVTASGASVRVFSTKTGEQLTSLDCKNGVKYVAWNPVFDTLAFAGDDRPAMEVAGLESEVSMAPRFREKVSAAVFLATFQK